ncbi:UTRA domain-containing protein [Aliivibrio sp. 1S128]|uniref:UTRA domain-containing protein n=1 Tax=Aliivibrio sp. 1S128 TaxID=1840085 RepID=UPI00080EB1C6|nr:UTRA domain-containing protein [Aliivibrio sp. 1S128]OCH15280.1 GntR family transcriptional regulator [Aliivibrio sp. 1S128]
MQYLIIKNAIAEQIENGMLEPGHKLPSERVLADAFSTTRITLREALNYLALSGKVYKEERRGWFVSQEALIFNPAQELDILKVCKKYNRSYKTELIDSKRILAPKMVADTLNLPPFSYVVMYSRLIIIEGRKVAVQYQYLPEALFPSLATMDNDIDVISLLKEQYLLHCPSLRVKVGVFPATEGESAVLNISSGSMLMDIHQSAINNNKKGYLLQVIRCCHDVIEIEIK